MSTLPPHACRLRVCYAKDGRLAYLGHLEVMETIMRCVRRSGLPFEVGNGFARRMRIQFSQALPVGASSTGEYYDLMLSEPLDVKRALRDLKDASPAPLAPYAARLLPRRVPALEAWANLSRWEVCVRGANVDAALFAERVDQLLSEDELHFMRGDKPRSISLQKTLRSYEVSNVTDGVDLALETLHSEKGALRPAILVKAACGHAPLRVCRVGQWHANEDGTRTDPMEGFA